MRNQPPARNNQFWKVKINYELNIQITSVIQSNLLAAALLPLGPRDLDLLLDRDLDDLELERDLDDEEERDLDLELLEYDL